MCVESCYFSGCAHGYLCLFLFDLSLGVVILSVVKPKIFTSSFCNLEKRVAKRHLFSVLPDAVPRRP